MRARRRKRQVDHVTRLVAILLPQLLATCLLLAPGQAQPLSAYAAAGDEMSAPAPMEGQVMNDIAKSWSNMMEGYRRNNDVVLFPDDLVLVMKGHSEDSVVRALNSQEPRQTDDSSQPVHLDGLEVLHFLEHELEQDVIDPKLLAYDGMEIQELRLNDLGDPASHWRSKRDVRAARDAPRIYPDELAGGIKVGASSVLDAINNKELQVVMPPPTNTDEDHVGCSSPNDENIDTQTKAEGSVTHGAKLGVREEPLFLDLFKAKAPVEVIEKSEGTRKPASAAEPSSQKRKSESNSHSNKPSSPAGSSKKKSENIKSDEHKETSTTSKSKSVVKKQDGKQGKSQSISELRNGTSTAQKSAYTPERTPDTNDEIVSSEDPLRSNLTAVEQKPIVLKASPTIQGLISGDVKCEEEDRNPFSISVKVDDGFPKSVDKPSFTVSPSRKPLNNANKKGSPRKEQPTAPEPLPSLKKEQTNNESQQEDYHPENKNDHSSAIKTSHENVPHGSEVPTNQPGVLKYTATVPKKTSTDQTVDKAKKMLNETGALHPIKDNPAGSLNRQSATRSVYQQLSEKQPSSHDQECATSDKVHSHSSSGGTLIPNEVYPENHQYQPNDMMKLHEGIHHSAHPYAEEQHQPIHAIPTRSHQYAQHQQTLYAPHNNPMLSLEHAHLNENSRLQLPHLRDGNYVSMTHPGDMAGMNAYQSDISNAESHHDFLQGPDWPASMMERDSSNHNFNWNGPETGPRPSLPDANYAGGYTLTTQSPLTSEYHPINYVNGEALESTSSPLATTAASKKGKKKKKKKVWKLPFVPQTTTPAPWPMSLASLAPFLSMPEFSDYSSGTPPHRRYQNNFFLPPLPPLWDPNSMSPPAHSFEYMQPPQHDFSGLDAPYQHQADSRMAPPYLQYHPMPQMQAPWAGENYMGNRRRRRSLPTSELARRFPHSLRQESGDGFPTVMEYKYSHGQNGRISEARDKPHYKEHISKASAPEDQQDFYPINMSPRMNPALFAITHQSGPSLVHQPEEEMLGGASHLDLSLIKDPLQAQAKQAKSLGFTNSELSPAYSEDVSGTYMAARQKETNTGFSDVVGVSHMHPSKSQKYSQINLSSSPEFSGEEFTSVHSANLKTNPTGSFQTIPAEQPISIANPTQSNPEFYSPLAEIEENQELILRPDLTETPSAEQEKMVSFEEASPQIPEVSESVVPERRPDSSRSEYLTTAPGEKASDSVLAQSAQSSITEQGKKTSDQEEVFSRHTAAAEPITPKQEHLLPASDATHAKPSALSTQETPDIDPTLSGSSEIPNKHESPVLQPALPRTSEPAQERKATPVDKSFSAPVDVAPSSPSESEKNYPAPLLTTGKKKISDDEAYPLYSSLSSPSETVRQKQIPTSGSSSLSEALANSDESKLPDSDEVLPEHLVTAHQKKVIDQEASASLSEQSEPEQEQIAAKSDSLPFDLAALSQSKKATEPLSSEPAEIGQPKEIMDQHVPAPYGDAFNSKQQPAQDTSHSDSAARNQEQPVFLPVVNKNIDDPLVIISKSEQNQQQQERPKSATIQDKPISLSSAGGALGHISSSKGDVSEEKVVLHSLEASQSRPKFQADSAKKYLDSSKETVEEKFGIEPKNLEKVLPKPLDYEAGKKLETKTFSLPESELFEEKTHPISPLRTSDDQTDDLKNVHPSTAGKVDGTVQKDEASSSSERRQHETPTNLAKHRDKLSPEQEEDIMSAGQRKDRSCAESGGGNACAVQEQKPEPSPQSHSHPPQDGSGDHMMMAPAFPFRQPMAGMRPYGPPALPPALEELMPRAKETEEERAEREHKAVQRMIQLVNVLGSLQSFVADRAKTIVKRLHRIVEDEESESRCGG